MTESRRPVLAIVYGPGSASVMHLAKPANALCDLVWILDSTEIQDDTIIRLIRRFGTTIDAAGMSEEAAADALRPLQPDGIAAYADAQIGLASALAVRLGLDYHDADVAPRLLDKLTQRRALHAAGIPIPKCVDMPTAPAPGEVAALVADVAFPVVLKPRRGAASRDTVLVGDAAELERILANQRIAGSEELMVIEEYMVGASPPPSASFADYLSVESIVANGTISHLCVTGRTPQVEPFRETGYVIPSDFAPALIAEALDLATQAMSALGVRTGCFHTEIKATTAGLRVIEVNGRIGGFVPEVLAAAAPGVDFYEISQRVALGEHVEFPEVVATDGVGWLLVEQPPLFARQVVSVEGLDALATYDGVAVVNLARQPGDAVDWRKGSHEYVYAVIGSAADYAGVKAAHDFIAKEVNVNYA
jgi:hypothetical protein